MRTRSLLILPTFSLALMAAGDVALEPGRWEEKFVPSSIVFDGKPLPAQELAGMTQTRARCLAPAKAADPLTFLLEREADCGTPKTSGGAAGFETSVSCPGVDGVGRTITGTGSWRQKDYKMEMEASGATDGKTLVIKATTSGSHAGPCRGDEDKD